MAALAEMLQLIAGKLKKMESAKPSAPELESRSKAPPSSSRNTGSNASRRISSMKGRSEDAQLARSAIIAYMKKNDNLPEIEKDTWQKVVWRKKVPIRTYVKRIEDLASLEGLLRNKELVQKILAGRPGLQISPNIAKNNRVFIKDGKLTTLSRDYKGGVGNEYL